jgi:hypothetical protein
MFDLVIESLPELQTIEGTVSDLERKHGESQARVQALGLRTAQARELDLNAEAVALNSGRKPPKPTEPQLREQLEGAGRDAEVLERRLSMVLQRRARYLSEHHGEILALLSAAHDAQGERVAAAASEALEALLAYHKAEDDARGLQRLHPAPQEENWGGPESMSIVFGSITTRNVSGENRGALEGVLRQLVAMGAPTIVEAGAEDDDEGGEDAA